MSTFARATLCISAAIVLTAAGPGFSQQPTDEQKSAIRAQCRSDYEAHCASVPPGGLASLQCLQKNIASLSPSCQTAVRAVEPAASAPKAEPAPNIEPPPKADATPPAAPAAAPPKAAASPPSTKFAPSSKPTDAQAAAIRSACRADYQKNCAGVPPSGSAALSCLQKSKSKLSQACQQAVDGVGAPAGSAAAGTPSGPQTTAAPPAATPPLLRLRPMRPREELMILRSACGGDVRALCDGIPPGGGRIAQCLASHAASLSPACKSVLTQFAAQ